MVAEILETIASTIESKLASQKKVVLAICGGSCTRKSSLVTTFLSYRFKGQCVAISQDQFQWQPTYLTNVDPTYKWDHPDNFSIEQCYSALSELWQNKTVKIPDYQFKKQQEVGYKTITPNPIIILEGLYANFNTLDELNDISVYVESPWYARMIRRIFRNTLDRYKGKEHEPILNAFCNSVTAAHRHFVIHQKKKSDYTLQVPLAFHQIMERYDLKPVEFNPANPSLELTLFYSGNLSIVLSVDNDTQSRFVLFYNQKPYLNFKISDTLAKQLKRMDWLAY